MRIATDEDTGRRPSFLAILSLICGIVSWLIVPFIAVVAIAIFGAFALFAVLLGHFARREIRRADGRLSGAGLAKSGLILGYGQIAASTLLIALLVTNARR